MKTPVRIVFFHWTLLELLLLHSGNCIFRQRSDGQCGHAPGESVTWEHERSMLQTKRATKMSSLAQGGFTCDGETLTISNIVGCRRPNADTELTQIEKRLVPFIFVHMPKAGGTTVEHYLRKYLELSEPTKDPLHDKELRCIRERALDKWLTWPASQQKQIQFFSSKHSARAMEFMQGKHLMTTILRNPIQRMVSQWKYIRSGMPHIAGSCTMKDAPGDSVKDMEQWYLVWRDKLPDFNNYEVRLLLTRSEAPDIVNSSELSAVLKRHCQARTLPVIQQRHLELAMARLSRMSLIGIMERMEQTLSIWNYTLPGLLGAFHKRAVKICGNANHQDCGRQRASPSYEVPVSLQQQMEKDNWASMKLWDHAMQLFEAQVQYALRDGWVIEQPTHT